MRRTVTFLARALVWLPLVLLPWQSPATAQDSVLYEVVENLDLSRLEDTGVRVSYWTAKGTAQAGSPFCPAGVVARLAPTATACTVTAFGADSIDLATLGGTMWANIASVVNCDNVVDGAECAVLTGQMEGLVSLVPFDGVPALGKRRQILGPAVPLIHVVGTFAPDAEVTLRQSPPGTEPPTGSIKLRATFRLPFQVLPKGRPLRGQPDTAFYLGDDGSLIRAHKHESALGEPVPRLEVIFDVTQSEDREGPRGDDPAVGAGAGG